MAPRYLRATQWAGAQAAIKRLEETLRWRREFGIVGEKGTWQYVEPEVRLFFFTPPPARPQRE
jgi:hypothetical protein